MHDDIPDLDIKITSVDVKAEPRALGMTWGIRYACGQFTQIDGSLAVLLECEATHDGEAPEDWLVRLVPECPPAHLVHFCPDHHDVDLSAFHDSDKRAYRVVRIIPPNRI